MPELPEVETVVKRLKKEILKHSIKEVIVKDNRLFKGVSGKTFIKKVEGKAINDAMRRGKVLVLGLNRKLFIIFHLRISGWIVVGRNIEKSARVIFKLSGQKFLNFCDQRVLGEIRLLDDWRKLPIIKNMGPEPLKIKKKDFVSLFEGKKAKVKPLLMDQAFIAGVGNIYAQECLFCAGVHPEKSANNLTTGELEKIYDCLIAILKKAIKQGGSSVDTYRQADGKKGGFSSYLKVYQRQNQSCFRCHKTIRKKVIGQRGTCFCPHCQK